MIPAEAVEAAAKVVAVRGFDWHLYIDDARMILEAAAPHLLAQAWEEGYTLGYADCANKQESNRPNPYTLNNEGEK